MPEETVMTDPVDRISGTKELDRNTPRGGRFKGEKPKRHHGETEDDSVEISEEARERASGGKDRGAP